MQFNRIEIKKLLILSISTILLCGSLTAYGETYWEAYKNVFGGELAKKYPNAGTSKIECEKMIDEYIKNYATLNQNCRVVTVNGQKKQICTKPDVQQAGVREMAKEMYCDPENRKKSEIKNAPADYVDPIKYESMKSGVSEYKTQSDREQSAAKQGVKYTPSPYETQHITTVKYAESNLNKENESNKSQNAESAPKETKSVGGKIVDGVITIIALPFVIVGALLGI